MIKDKKNTINRVYIPRYMLYVFLVLNVYIDIPQLRYGDLIQQYEVSLSRMLNDILTLDQQWLPNQSDFPPISWPRYRVWPSPNYEWFPWSISNGFGMPAGNAYPSGHLVPSPILGLADAPIVETKFLELAMSLLDFSPRIPLGTFSILLIAGTIMETECCQPGVISAVILLVIGRVTLTVGESVESKIFYRHERAI